MRLAQARIFCAQDIGMGHLLRALRSGNENYVLKYLEAAPAARLPDAIVDLLPESVVGGHARVRDWFMTRMGNVDPSGRARDLCMAMCVHNVSARQQDVPAGWFDLPHPRDMLHCAPAAMLRLVEADHDRIRAILMRADDMADCSYMMGTWLVSAGFTPVLTALVQLVDWNRAGDAAKLVGIIRGELPVAARALLVNAVERRESMSSQFVAAAARRLAVRGLSRIFLDSVILWGVQRILQGDDGCVAILAAHKLNMGADGLIATVLATMPLSDEEQVAVRDAWGATTVQGDIAWTDDVIVIVDL